jgi:hypothetical protein
VNSVKVDLAAASSIGFVSGSGFSTQRAVLITQPKYSAANAQTIATAATLDIVGAPLSGTNVTITNPYAFQIENSQNFFSDSPSTSTTYNQSGGGPYPNYASTKINTSLSSAFPGLTTNNAHVSAFQSAIQVPTGAKSAIVGLGGSFYAQNVITGGSVIALFGSGQAAAMSQNVFGANTVAGDCNRKVCTDLGATIYGAAKVVSIEADNSVASSSTLFSANFLSEKLAGTTSQGGTFGAPADYAFLVGKDANILGSFSCVTMGGCGSDPMVSSGGTYSGNVNTTYCIKFLTATTFKWGFFGCPIASDLAVDMTTAGKVTSATHKFTQGDLGTTLEITGSAGWTAGNYTFTSITDSPNSAQITGPTYPATTGTTGGTFTLWESITGTVPGVASTPYPLVMPADTSTFCIPNTLTPAAPTQCLQGAQIRPISTSYGVSAVFAGTGGYTAGNTYTMPVTGVPPTHGAFTTEAGSADYFAIISPVNSGQSQPSQAIQLNSLNSSGNVLQGTINLDASGNLTLTPPGSGAALVSGTLDTGALNTTGALNVNSALNVTAGGLINTYFSTSLAASMHGVPATLAIASTTSSTTSAGTTNVVASAPFTAEYRLNYYLVQVGPGTGCTGNTTVTLVPAWTDGVRSRTATFGPVTLTIVNNTDLATNVVSGTFPIIATSASAISYTTTYVAGTGCGATPPPYSVYVWAELM